MDAHSSEQLGAFFSAVAPWRPAYSHIRLNFVGIRRSDKLLLIRSRIIFSAVALEPRKSPFKAGQIEAGQWDINQSQSVEHVIQVLTSEVGLSATEFGNLLVPPGDNGIRASNPVLLHPEGLAVGNRLAVITVSGAPLAPLLPQPESDWLVRASDVPYDSIGELCFDFGVAIPSGDLCLLEVVARPAVEVLARSEVRSTSATLGVWMAASLDQSRAKIGFRVLDQGKVTSRGAVAGAALRWALEGVAAVGTTTLEVPVGAIVQCVTSFDEHAHDVKWLADISTFQNPRSAALSLVDPNRQLLRSYLQPDSPLKNTSADEFEAAVSWVLWGLGFSPAWFGITKRTRDTFDIVAATPRGDFIVVECTLGLLRADSKLSRLIARAASLRAALEVSNTKGLRVLPVIVTALGHEEVKGDVDFAHQNGVLVVTRELIERGMTELLKFPSPDALYERAVLTVEQNKAGTE